MWKLVIPALAVALTGCGGGGGSTGTANAGKSADAIVASTSFTIAGYVENCGCNPTLVAGEFRGGGIKYVVVSGWRAGNTLMPVKIYRLDNNGTTEDATTDILGTDLQFSVNFPVIADFNNDGWLDLFHVNGFSGGGDASVSPFLEDYSQLFISDQNGGFLERAIPLGISDNRQGRGIVCFDYDRDGDIDLFIANNRQAPVLYRNDSTSNGNYLNIKLEGEQKNSEAVGARIYLTTNGITQMRELRVGSNYMSQNPVEAHFGLGTATAADMIRIVWPSGTEKILEDVDANQMLFISLP